MGLRYAGAPPVNECDSGKSEIIIYAESMEKTII